MMFDFADFVKMLLDFADFAEAQCFSAGCWNFDKQRRGERSKSTSDERSKENRGAQPRW